MNRLNELLVSRKRVNPTRLTLFEDVKVPSTYFYYTSKDSAIALIHSPTPFVDTIGRVKNAPTCTTPEEFSIATTVEYAVEAEPPATTIFMFSDSQEALQNISPYTTHL